MLQNIMTAPLTLNLGRGEACGDAPVFLTGTRQSLLVSLLYRGHDDEDVRRPTAWVQ